VALRSVSVSSRIGQVGAADLIVGADGVNSVARRDLEDGFHPHIDWLTNKFAWYGTTKTFDCLTLTFSQQRARGVGRAPLPL